MPVAVSRRIEKLSECLDLSRHCNDKIYHNAGKLLRVYKSVRWRLSQSLDEMGDECMAVSSLSLKEALFNLLDLDTDLDKLNLEDRLKSLAVSRQLVEIIDKSLIMLKTYPGSGERCFDIINKCFLLEYPYSENEILENLNISRTTYYKQKKKAVSMLGVILWGFLLPDLKAV